ncbi:dihydrodipicolinate synthase family protein [Maribellus sp. YY47]|uniref:dihydrodipicolinate synthase family protein n=1 Tax=Maribellus sp. YY47 TaxID=2929486 RepID=UPI0020017BB4|nr:dihydrodipicolinate synthase family protein [Maribellus sp. YY47]MCK3683210.1 dihydrodipicolinate synthase family protein [Maribellus sp. YY47]
MNRFNGLIAAPFTPMDNKGEVVYGKIPDYVGLLEKNKVVGAFVNGSTGEGVSLSQKEKMQITEEWVKAASGKKELKIINLIGGTSYKECIENAKHSEECGVDAIAMLAPYYFKPGSGGQLAEYCAKVAEAVPDVPFYFYHIPVLSGCFVPMYDFLQEASGMIPNLAGIKYTHEDFMDFLSCIHFADGKYDMLWGRDENLLSALVLGARGGVGSTYNYAAPLYYQLIDAFDNGDLAKARKLQQQSIDMIRLLGKYGGIATGKAYMRYIGFECGEFRLPIKNMSSEAYQKFEKDVQGLQIQELFSTL